jgi:hypothetical protein
MRASPGRDLEKLVPERVVLALVLDGLLRLAEGSRLELLDRS